MRSMSNIDLELSSLLTIPVKVLPATRDREPRWHKCHEHRDGTLWQVEQFWRCTGCADEVLSEDIARGEYDDHGNVVPFTGSSSGYEPKGIFLLTAIHGDELTNPVLFGKPFILEPNISRKARGSRLALEQYATLRAVLTDSGRQLIVRHVLRDGDKPKLACVRADGDALVMQNVCWPHEVNDVAELPVLGQHVELDQRAVKLLAEHLDERTTGWDHDEYFDGAA